MTFALFTNRFSKWKPEQGVGVRTTLGHPRFWPKEKPLVIDFRLITPKRSFVDAPEPEYERAYLQMLEDTGVPTLRAAFQALATREQNPNLVLLCFEDLAKPGLFCHRRIFARWWEAETSNHVRELQDEPSFTLRPDQDTLL